MTQKNAKSGKRIGTSMRGQLQQAYDERGSALSKLYTCYSLKCKRDVILTGDLRLLHFLLRESDPSVLSINYAPSPRSEEHRRHCHVEFLSKDGTLHVESIRASRHLTQTRKAVICDALRADYLPLGGHRLGDYKKVEVRVLTDQDILPSNETRLRNWNRLLMRFAATRHCSLVHAERVLMARLESSGTCTVRDFVDMDSEHARTSQLLSAAIKSAANGVCQADLDTKPFSMATQFWLRGRQ